VRDLLEGVRLQNVTVVLNPDDLEVFDRNVGNKGRSEKLRELIREFNQSREDDNEMVQASKQRSR